jgi:hypothetical protein
MERLRTLLAIGLLGLSGFAAAQVDGDRASTPPGTARDGSAPADGAIKGGAILPGESGGMPDSAPALPGDRALARCHELSGTLRDQCLRDARSAGAGGTAPAEAPPTVRDPVQAPPPQNPR